jgi:hypothetical protein
VLLGGKKMPNKLKTKYLGMDIACGCMLCEQSLTQFFAWWKMVILVKVSWSARGVDITNVMSDCTALQQQCFYHSS